MISDLQSGVVITQVSISLGECETDESTGELNTDDQYFATMTSLGASVFVSTGDSGSDECGNGGNTPVLLQHQPARRRGRRHHAAHERHQRDVRDGMGR